MECFIPLNHGVSAEDIANIKQSHDLRKFVIFDEQLKVVLKTKLKPGNLTKFTIWINDALMLDSSNVFDDIFEEVTEEIWELKHTVCSDQLFKSTVVMNNGYDNVIKFQIEYNTDECMEVVEPQEENSDSDDEILPSFEPLYSWSTRTGAAVDDPQPLETAEINLPEEKKSKHLTLEYPIYSLLNMRLRNSVFKSKSYILSSLDFQTSKSLIQLIDKHFTNDPKVNLHFRQINYELVDNKNTKLRIEPLLPLQLPLVVNKYDSYCTIYKLSFPQSSTIPHRVKITLDYNVSCNEMKIPILTSWETDVTIKKSISKQSQQQQQSLGALSRMSSTLSTPKLLQSRNSFLESGASMASLLNNKSNNVKFKFLQKTITTKKGEPFILSLQIANFSNSALDLVVYHNNKIPNFNNANATLAKQVQLLQKYRKQTEGIILLTNDYKIPVVKPNDTILVDLKLIGIMSGYFSDLVGLKILDLKANEVIEIGRSVSVYVE
ncbi:hypothetical protein KAFR_0K00910 [Kazachstania africana CBS 2517]|uniref:Uncharacterized protein n=1 Tax=Kazachstania africana (strain ATCC 22294 / BCRC 22015 / CBS 2517 / CECT 1963 / NBRC 1671 / NRRL Y-8276) TaxID=1071382 RepID=H2B1E7_KAZAF|nr:hypothetical protein KAFR_0K00910 [Kazachstania africana CBS 2517]CCF60447.1 hypothetical protein KAFR_0K00910 [Kazachstania africana CBS 2517]